ncbi:hypothetical protein CA264_19865 [Pontibacter actiniarum]|uniref:Uncharacterized protein n=1 Tax=Pontibacter actiniarum TaxID=323450 RepID=A0A1X9YXA7_9BACT|nr:hypothetical protein CA264_19865 [Pontibacter actiniarum]
MDCIGKPFLKERALAERKKKLYVKTVAIGTAPSPWVERLVPVAVPARAARSGARAASGAQRDALIEGLYPQDEPSRA